MRLITTNELKALLTAGILLTVALLATGCATIAAHQVATAKWQSLADQATTALHIAPVSVVTTAGVHGRYTCASRRLELGTEDLPERSIRWLLAHELGHALSDQCGDTLASEQAANAAAVRVLVAWGMTEPQAAKEVILALWSAAEHDWMRNMPGHDACAEMIAMLRTYPDVVNLKDGVCTARLKAGG